MSLYVFSVSVCVSIFIFSAHCQLEEGAACVSKSDGLAGKCASIRHCLSTVEDIKRKKHPQLCSFNGRDPIVCCTDCKLVNDTSAVYVDINGNHYFKTGRKAIDKCFEHIVNLDYPCLIKEGFQRRLDEMADGSGIQCYDYQKPFIAAAIGGSDARRAEFPHMALLGYGDTLDTAQWLCGGSVISDRFILTAAHCIASNAVGTVKYVALGILKRTDPSETWQRYNVKRAIRHPEHKPPSKYNDIALLEVDNKIKFGKDVLPACLNAGDNDESNAIATGWGALGHRKTLADTLQVVFLAKFSDLECAGAYPPHRHLVNGYDHSSQSCYGDRNNIIDTCEGDSGGPLQVASILGTCVYKIIGVTSYGRACGQLGGAGMYTKVAHYIPWIESVVWP